MFKFDMRRLNKTADKVLKLEEEMKSKPDSFFNERTSELKELLRDGISMESILIEAFAMVREAAFRTIGLKHYKVQVIGGIALHEGRIAEMRTGEGKTLTETLPAYLNALTGKGVHIVTVNEYLAERDHEIMSPIFAFLGLTSGVVLSTQTPQEKMAAYRADITYITNHEVGFDYLRDHLIKNPEDRLQRDLNFVIVDEIDSILIDEARTPLIITREKSENCSHYRNSDVFVKTLSKEDVIINEKDKYVELSESGMEKVEKYYGLSTYTENPEIVHYVKQSLKANFLMRKDKDYVVIDDEVVIVDEFTGRLGAGRRYSSGLHQAIEAKECVPIKNETGTLATITYQNFFRSYNKLSGMTGTALTEEKEFNEIYGLDVVAIPTNKPIIRKDHEDRIYLKNEYKLMAIIEEIKKSYYKGQPVLVGTTSVEKSEELSKLLHKELIPHSLLNAKNHKKEAEIISMAGEKGAVTIATNMAGRGTDISLGKGVAELGGLKVIGTERHESRRIDNQLKGRSGRQGDIGESIFFISLEDDLLKLFGGQKMTSIFKTSGKTKREPISHPLLSKQVVSAQKQIEGMHFSSRKYTIQYDNVLNEQRKVVYNQRNKVLYDEVDLRDLLIQYGASKEEVECFYSEILKDYFLNIIDEEWIEHVDYMMDLRQDAGNASYKGQDPVVEYMLRSKEIFEDMIERIQIRTLELFRNQISMYSFFQNESVDIGDIQWVSV